MQTFDWGKVAERLGWGPAGGQAAEKKYNPDQPRAPKGDPEGGQWVSQGDSEGSGSAPEPWQMTKAQWWTAQNAPILQAAQDALQAGKVIVLPTFTKRMDIVAPESLKLGSSGDILLYAGRNQWNTLTSDQVEKIAMQVGVVVPPPWERKYHFVEIERALAEGKPVSDAVLADYPSIKRPRKSRKS